MTLPCLRADLGVTYQLDENAQAKVRELYAEDRAEAWRKIRTAQIMSGDGDGI